MSKLQRWKPTYCPPLYVVRCGPQACRFSATPASRHSTNRFGPSPQPTGFPASGHRPSTNAQDTRPVHRSRSICVAFLCAILTFLSKHSTTIPAEPPSQAQVSSQAAGLPLTWIARLVRRLSQRWPSPPLRPVLRSIWWRWWWLRKQWEPRQQVKSLWVVAISTRLKPRIQYLLSTMPLRSSAAWPRWASL